MANLFDLFQQNLSGDLLKQLGSQVGISDETKTKEAATGAFSVLMGALNKNASSTSGANMLSSVLDRDHDGSILDDVMGYISGSSNVSNAKATDGSGILGHLLGNNQSSVVDQISSLVGIDKNSSASLLTKLAPLAMGMLGKMKSENNLDASGLQNVLKSSVAPAQQNSMLSGLMTSFLDKDGDGNIVDDLADMGMNALKGFFSKK
ncbi:MAG: DUF937 domain-containing protein [Saprospiraceae bacterium]